MTDKELTIWEHLDSVMRVLTSKEMGAWLYRRDKRVLVTELEKIKAEINKKSATMIGIGKDIQVLEVKEVAEVIENYISKLKGE